MVNPSARWPCEIQLREGCVGKRGAGAEHDALRSVYCWYPDWAAKVLYRQREAWTEIRSGSERAVWCLAHRKLGQDEAVGCPFPDHQRCLSVFLPVMFLLSPRGMGLFGDRNGG
jgi:hypothetical protein